MSMGLLWVYPHWQTKSEFLNQKLDGDNFCFQKFIRTGNYLLLSGSVTSVTFFYILNIYQLSFKKWNFDAQHPGA